MANFVIPNVFAPNTVADANAVNANFTAIQNQINAGIPAGSLTSIADLSALNWYNFFNFGALVNGGTVNNSTAFQEMLATMSALNGGSGGGIAYIPAGTFPINPGPGSGYVIPIQTVFQGAGATVANAGGGGGPGQSTLSMQGDGTLLFGYESHTSGGVYFRNIAFGCVGATLATTSCINANLWNCVAEDCVFDGFPTAIVAGLQAGSRGCTFHYAGSVNNCQQIILNTPQPFVIGPGEFYQLQINNGGPTGCSAISIQGTEHAQVEHHHIFYWQYGIDYNQSSVKTLRNNFIDLHMQIYSTAVRMVPSAATGRIFGEKYTACHIRKSDESVDNLPVVQIDANGGPTTNINDIEFNDCTVYADVDAPQANQYIYEIGVCSDWRIIGGYAGNASPSGGAAIAITGACGDGLVMGTNLSPSYPHANTPSAAQWALLVTAAPAGLVQFIGVNMRGYTGPVSVTASLPISLEIIDCPGYNDVPTIITEVMPATDTSFSAQTAGARPYFGPATFEVTGGTITSIAFYPNANPASLPEYTSPLTSGTFELSPGQFCKIIYTGSPSFVMVGR